jgi:hypothetical protein
MFVDRPAANSRQHRGAIAAPTTGRESNNVRARDGGGAEGARAAKRVHVQCHRGGDRHRHILAARQAHRTSFSDVNKKQRENSFVVAAQAEKEDPAPPGHSLIFTLVFFFCIFFSKKNADALLWASARSVRHSRWSLKPSSLNPNKTHCLTPIARCFLKFRGSHKIRWRWPDDLQHPLASGGGTECDVQPRSSSERGRYECVRLKPKP